MQRQQITRVLLWGVTGVVLCGSQPLLGGVIPSSAQQFPADGMDTLRIAQEEGTTTVIGADTNQITATFTQRGKGDGCEPKFITAGSTFRVISRDGAAFNHGECKADIKLTVPRRFAVRAGLAAGELTLNGINGDLSLEVATGVISGVVTSKNTKIELAAGRVNLEWSQLPDPGTVMIEAGAGSITLTVPRGSVVATQLRRALAPVIIDVPERDNATFTIRGRLAIGAFAVHAK